MNPGAALTALLCPLVVGLVIGCLIGAVILRAACWLYNKLAGSPTPKLRPRDYDYDPPAGLGRGGGTGIQEVPDQGYRPPAFEDIREPEYESPGSAGVPEPTFGQAFAIVLVAYLIHLVVSVAVNFAMLNVGGGPALAPGMVVGLSRTSLLSSLIMVPIGILIQGGIISAMLPTSFGKGLLVALLCFAIGLVIALIVGAVAVAVIFALYAGR